MAYSAEQRSLIMKCIQRNNHLESRALEVVSLDYPEVRAQIRAWFYERWLYLLKEYERVLPHIEEIPDV